MLNSGQFRKFLAMAALKGRIADHNLTTFAKDPGCKINKVFYRRQVSNKAFDAIAARIVMPDPVRLYGNNVSRFKKVAEGIFSAFLPHASKRSSNERYRGCFGLRMETAGAPPASW